MSLFFHRNEKVPLQTTAHYTLTQRLQGILEQAQ